MLPFIKQYHFRSFNQYEVKCSTVGQFDLYTFLVWNFTLFSS